MGPGIFELAVVIGLAAVLSLVAKLLRQPLVVAYLVTGMMIGYFGFFNLGDHEVFEMFSQLGIMFLLFLVGLEINYTSLRLVGKATLFVGFGQILLTSSLGFLLAYAFGFAWLPCLYIAAALTFSSTIIVVKLLTDKQDFSSLYGKISVGVLLAQDVVAILVLILLAGIESGSGASPGDFVLTLGINVLLFFAVIILSRYVFPFIFDKIARSQELLFLSSLAWVFLMALIVTRVGMSIEVAGFLAGVALANSAEHFQIAGYIRPLRDFFIVIFFVILGSSFVFSNLSGLLWPVLVFSLFVLIVKPLIIMAIMGLAGYRKRSGFMAGTILAQVSEFSLLLIAVGLRLGHVNDAVVAIVTVTGIITIIFSSYMSNWSDNLYKIVHKVLGIFEKNTVKKESMAEEVPKKPIVLIGYHRTGKSIMNNLENDDVLIIDFDPEVVHRAKYLGIACILGDVRDPEILALTHMRQAKLIISTSPDIQDSMRILNFIKDLKRKPKIIARAETERDAQSLYNAGATYVLLPLFSVGDYLGKALTLPTWGKTLKDLKKRDLNLIKKINSV